MSNTNYSLDFELNDNNFLSNRFGIDDKNIQTLVLPNISEFVQPILFSLPIQLLAYYAAVFKKTDVDQPRNLAKSVTVE